MALARFQTLTSTFPVIFRHAFQRPANELLLLLHVMLGQQAVALA
jgi:hypothetical protein